MAIRGTENYVYYIDSVLGSGSTAKVYFGRHKRKGDPCAIKVYDEHNISNRRIFVRDNELDYMKKLNHQNIVKCLAIEKDLRSNNNLLIMELCTEGSIAKILNQDKYFNGLHDEEFINLIGHLSHGIHYLRIYGITHRDIKHGNILCYKEENGQITFKLTDFGATKEVFSDNKEISPLYGTEEFLHPQVYKTVVISNLKPKQEMEESNEKWSIGVTLYVSCTNMLPFKVPKGREDRAGMYKLTSLKPHNAIAGEILPDNNFNVYTYALPNTCNISEGLKTLITPLLAGLIETDPSKQIEFCDYFTSSELIYTSLLVHIYNVATYSFMRIYLQPNNTYKDLTNSINLQLQNVLSVNSRYYLLYGDGKLLDQIEEITEIRNYPITSKQSPIILIPKHEELQRMWNNRPLFPLPNKPQENGYSLNGKKNDVKYALACCAYCCKLLQISENLLLGRKHSQFSNIILNNIRMKILKKFEEKTNVLSQNLEMIEVSSNITKNRINALIDINKYMVRVEDSNTKKLLYKKKKLITNAKSKYIAELDHINTKIKDISEKIKSIIDVLNYEKSYTFIYKPNSLACEDRDCNGVLSVQLRELRDIEQSFIIDEKEELTYNQDQIHKYHKKRITEILNNATNTFHQHCIPDIINTQSVFLQTYSKLYDHLLNIDNNSKDSSNLINELHCINVMINDINIRYDKEILSSNVKNPTIPSNNFADNNQNVTTDNTLTEETKLKYNNILKVLNNNFDYLVDCNAQYDKFYKK